MCSHISIKFLFKMWSWYENVSLNGCGTLKYRYGRLVSLPLLLLGHYSIPEISDVVLKYQVL